MTAEVTHGVGTQVTRDRDMGHTGEGVQVTHRRGGSTGYTQAWAGTHTHHQLDWTSGGEGAARVTHGEGQQGSHPELGGAQAGARVCPGWTAGQTPLHPTTQIGRAHV